MASAVSVVCVSRKTGCRKIHNQKLAGVPGQDLARMLTLDTSLINGNP